MYARYERGASALPIHHLIYLTELYNVSSDYILGITNNPVPYKEYYREAAVTDQDPSHRENTIYTGRATANSFPHI